MTPAGIDPTTFRFVAQHLNHYATVAPLPHCPLWNVKEQLYFWHFCHDINTSVQDKAPFMS